MEEQQSTLGERGDKTPGGNDNPITPSNSTSPKEVKVKVDLSRKPEQEDEKVQIQNDDDFFDDQVQQTDKDVINDEKEKARLADIKSRLNTSQTTSAPSEPIASGKPSAPYDKKRKNADKIVRALDLINMWAMKAWSGQADNVGLETSKPDLEAIAEALADVMEDSDWNPNPLLALITTAIAVWGSKWTNAADSKKKIKELKKNNPNVIQGRIPAVRPEFDAGTGLHRKGRGRQHK